MLADTDLLFWIAADLPLPELTEEATDERHRLTFGDLRGYQTRLVGLIEQCFTEGPDKLPGLLLALEPGAGKTGTTLQALRRLLDAGTIRRAIIVAPLLVAQTVWHAELDEWAELTRTTYTIIRVEDDDPELVAYSDRVYKRALGLYQRLFEAHVAREPVLKPTQARGAVRHRWKERAEKRRPEGDKSKLCYAPSELADRIRNKLVLKFKYAKLSALADTPTELHIINKEAFPWLWENFGNGRRWPYQALVTDDLREGRSGKKRVKRGKDDKTNGPAPLSRFGALARARKRVKATIQLTGTPTPKGLENVWGLSYLIDLGERLGDSKKQFLDKWFNINTFSHEVKARDGAFDEIMGKVKDIMFSIDPEEIAQLPEFVINPIRVKLSPEEMRKYREMERDYVLEEHDVAAVNGGVLHGKLLQLANGSVYNEDGNDIPIHDRKIEALRDLIERLDGTPLLVAYTYQFDVDRICAAFPYARVLRPENAVETVKLWNKDKLPLVLAHRASAGHGLNLQKGTGHMCEYGLTTDVELFTQFMKRLHRPGRRDTVFNHVIMAEGTIDEKVYPMYLDPRIETQNEILKAIRLTDRP